MDIGWSELIAALAGAVAVSLRSVWALRRRFGHQHVFYTMQADGRFHCELCGAPKKRGS